MNMPVCRIPVLIVGAGFAGLTAALLLSYRGIACRVIERRATTTHHPKAHGINLRSLELLRIVPGLEDELHDASRAQPDECTVWIGETITGPAIETLLTPARCRRPHLSPARICSAGQDRVEPILLRRARGLGANVEFETEFVGFEEKPEGILATARNLNRSEPELILADYLIGADGASGKIRERLGIAMQGRGTFSHAVSILFEADLPSILHERGFLLCYLRNHNFTGAFVTCDDPHRGQLNIEYDPLCESTADFDVARCVDLVRSALGMPGLAVNVLEVLPWKMSALLADRMSCGRVFLAGDAAHIVPPVGGLGGQTAIQDAADLAWKLALVLQGHADPNLLATYDAERRPVAELTIARQTENYVERMHPERVDLRHASPLPDYLAVAMGYHYRSDAILDDATGIGPRAEGPSVPSGRPGTRLAHVPLLRDGVTISSLDLIAARGFTLIAAPVARDWVMAAREIAEATRLPIDIVRIGHDVTDPDGSFLSKSGLAFDGALLVRPDGFIAWHSGTGTPDPTQVLNHVFGRVFGREIVIHQHAE
jgi:putative polyketide hydroxylase